MIVGSVQQAISQKLGLTLDDIKTRHYALRFGEETYTTCVEHTGLHAYEVSMDEVISKIGVAEKNTADKKIFKVEVIKHDLIDGLKNSAAEILLSINGHTRKYVWALEDNTLHIHNKDLGAHPVTYVSRFSTSNLKADGAGYKAAMPGRIIDVLVEQGQTVKEGDKLLTMESMKMEHSTFAKSHGVVAQLFVGNGKLVNKGDTLIDIQDK